jgi:YgiT-type zinc finger domain-containing protein
MKCPICKNGETAPAKISVTLNEALGATIVFRDVPALVCDNCGEEYMDESTSGELLRQARAAADSGVQVEVRTFKAA